MKKSLMFIMLGIISFLGINSVSADSTNYSNYYSNYSSIISDSSTYSTEISNLISYFNNNFSSTYSDYLITFDYNSSSLYQINLYATNSLDFYSYNSNGSHYLYTNNSSPSEGYSYNITSGLYNTFNYSSFSFTTMPYSSSSPLIFVDNKNCSANINSNCDNSITLPSYENYNLGVLYTEMNIKNNEVIPTYMSLIKENHINIPASYVEIDLNKYSYVILSLKDYTPRDTFTSTMYVKGQLCPTTLYNYGMEEKKDYVSGYQTQPCSSYYNNLVPFTTYIKSEDIKNHAVYYLTAYNTSKPNSVKVDTSVYAITYITSDKKDDPYVSVGGKNYPALPYDDLTDSSTLTEKNGISNEWTCAKYDTDCLENSSGMNINDLFDKPLEFLKGLWNSITSIFEVITEFIGLLPSTMQSFLYLSFMVAIVLGLLKLIL